MTNDAAASGAPRFDVVLRGYDRKQVDEHVARMQRVIGRMRADLEVARSQPLPVVLPAAQRPQPAPRARPGEVPDVVGSFTDRMQSILQAAEEEAAEIRKKAHVAARHETQAARAEISELSRQRDVLVGELNRMRGQLESLLAAPTTQMPAHRPSPVRRPPPGPATGGQTVVRPFADPQSVTLPSTPGPSTPGPSVPGSADLTQPAVMPPPLKQPTVKPPVVKQAPVKRPAIRSDEAETVVSAVPKPNDVPAGSPTAAKPVVDKPVDLAKPTAGSAAKPTAGSAAPVDPAASAEPKAAAVPANGPGTANSAPPPTGTGTEKNTRSPAADGEKAAPAELFRPRTPDVPAGDAEATVKVSAVRAGASVKATPVGSAGSAGSPPRPSPKPKPRPSASPTAATPIVQDDVRDSASAPSRSG